MKEVTESRAREAATDHNLMLYKLSVDAQMKRYHDNSGKGLFMLVAPPEIPGIGGYSILKVSMTPEEVLEYCNELSIKPIPMPVGY